jgi:hypothetical protein
MVYLVNFATPTPKVIGATGGGRIFFDIRKRRDIVDALNEFLATNAINGGDVTHIIPQRYEDGF